MLKKIFLPTALAFALTAGAASAAEMDFAYYGKELKSAEGAQKLYQRLEHQANEACHAPSARSLAEHIDEKRCAQELTQKIVAKINDQRLYAVHKSEDGGAERRASAGKTKTR